MGRDYGGGEVSQLDLFAAPAKPTNRAGHIHVARVYLAQVPAFRARGSSFVFVLLEWAANQRRRAMA